MYHVNPETGKINTCNVRQRFMLNREHYKQIAHRQFDFEDNSYRVARTSFLSRGNIQVMVQENLSLLPMGYISHRDAERLHGEHFDDLRNENTRVKDGVVVLFDCFRA